MSRTTRRLLLSALIIVGVLLLALAWWTARPAPSPSSTSSPPAPTTASTTAKESPSGPAGHGTASGPTSSSASKSSTSAAAGGTDQTWGNAALTASQHAALRSATAAAAAYARPAPGVDEASWRARLAPLLTATAIADIEAVDPRQVSYSRLTGPARLLEAAEDEADPATAEDGGVVQVLVPTDGAGEARWWIVDVCAGGGPESGRVERITVAASLW